MDGLLITHTEWDDIVSHVVSHKNIATENRLSKKIIKLDDSFYEYWLLSPEI